MRIGHHRTLTAVTAALILLSGCSALEPESTSASTPTTRPEAAWQVAKRDAQRLETVAVGLLAPDAVATIEQANTGTIEPCNSREYRWRGGTTVQLRESVRADQVIADLQTRLTENEWNVQGDSDVMRTPSIIASDPESRTRLHITTDVDTGIVRFVSASPCFDAADDVTAGDGY